MEEHIESPAVLQIISHFPALGRKKHAMEVFKEPQLLTTANE